MAKASDLIRFEAGAAILDVSTRAIHRYIATGKLDRVKDPVTGRCWLKADQVEELAKGRLRPAAK